MHIHAQQLIASLLALSVLLLTHSISGDGIIEGWDVLTSDSYAHCVFTASLFLIIGGSLLLLPLLWIKNLFAFKATLFLALGYMIVYLVSLSDWLTHHYTSVSTTAFWVQVLGLFLTMPLLMLTIDFIKTYRDKQQHINKGHIVIWQLLILFAFSMWIWFIQFV